MLYDAEGRYDLYLTQNRFQGRRKVLQQHVRELSALYVDLDYYDVPEVNGRPPEAIYEMALALLAKADIPEPSLVLSSGQGIYLVWLHTPVGWQELPRWQDCQYRMWKLLKPLGADAQARDAARVLRVVGTMNSKNGGFVYSLRDAGPRRGFEELATSILPAGLREAEGRPDAELHDLRMQRAARREYKAPRRYTERSLWLARWADLQILRRLRYGDGPMDDFRDRWLFIAGVAMSWITDPPEPQFLERELVGLAEEVGGWEEDFSRSRLQAVLDRVRRAARGETVVWEGSEWDPRYVFKTETILSEKWLGITPEEQRHMYNLIDEDEKRRRNTENRREKRRAEGVKARMQYEEARGASLQKNRAEARHLRDIFGLSTSEIAQIKGVSERTARRWLK